MPPTPGVAQTDVGEIRGSLEGDVFIYRGIPYAAPPTNELRWRAPAPTGPLPSPFVADQFGPDCTQATATG